MTGFRRPHVSSRTGRGNRGGIPNDELKARRRGGDYSHLGLVFPESTPDCNKDLPRIPSTSTGLWGDDAMTITTEMMGSPTASPIVGCPPLPVPSHQVCEREPLIEAQQIAVQCRQRRRSVNGDPVDFSRIPSSTAMQLGVSVAAQATNAPLRASPMLPHSPQIRRLLAEETDTTPTSYDGTGPLSRVREDGTFACDREDCLAILPNLLAFLSHLTIHLVHEGYVIHIGWRIGVLKVFNRVIECEHCGVLFTDDDHKDEHLNSCSKLPTLHEIGSLEDGPFGLLLGTL